MAQLIGQFDSEQAAQQAAQRLRAMDIPDSDIVLSREGKGASSYVLLTAEIPDFQFGAAQAIVNTARVSPQAGGPQTAGETPVTRTEEGANPGLDAAAMSGPGVIGSGALGGPAALTARAAAIGSERDVIGDDLRNDNPDTNGDTITSVSPR